MFKTILGVLALMFVVQIVLPPDAEARRGFKWRSGGSKKSIPVIIPIPRGSKDVVFVKKLPRHEAFTHKGKHFDLGYKHGWFGGGDWVGYFRGPPKGYIGLNQKVVKEKLLPALGITIADVPGKGRLKPNKKSADSGSASTSGSGSAAVVPLGASETSAGGFGGISKGYLFLAIILIVGGLFSMLRKGGISAARKKDTNTFMEEPITIDEPMITPEKNAKIEDSIQRALRDRAASQNQPTENPVGAMAKSQGEQQMVTRPARQPVRGQPMRAGCAKPAFGRR